MKFKKKKQALKLKEIPQSFGGKLGIERPQVIRCSLCVCMCTCISKGNDSSFSPGWIRLSVLERCSHPWDDMVLARLILGDMGLGHKDR